jgi:hypothetical protein
MNSLLVRMTERLGKLPLERFELIGELLNFRVDRRCHRRTLSIETERGSTIVTLTCGKIDPFQRESGPKNKAIDHVRAWAYKE